jgi:hypothetical protein
VATWNITKENKYRKKKGIIFRKQKSGFCDRYPNLGEIFRENSKRKYFLEKILRENILGENSRKSSEKIYFA